MPVSRGSSLRTSIRGAFWSAEVTASSFSGAASTKKRLLVIGFFPLLDVSIRFSSPSPWADRCRSIQTTPLGFRWAGSCRCCLPGTEHGEGPSDDRHREDAVADPRKRATAVDCSPAQINQRMSGEGDRRYRSDDAKPVPRPVRARPALGAAPPCARRRVARSPPLGRRGRLRPHRGGL
jgi:hypothetical protein